LGLQVLLKILAGSLREEINIVDFSASHWIIAVLCSVLELNLKNGDDFFVK